MRCLFLISTAVAATFLCTPASTVWSADATEPVASVTPVVSAEPARQLEFYNFASLLSKSERILVAEVGAENDGFVLLKNIQYVKAPVTKDIHPDLAQRAAERLAKEVSGVKDADSKKDVALPKISEIVPLRLAVNPGFKLPAQGSSAIFFLWERMPDGAKGEITYRAGHPQNIYDAALLPQVKAGVDYPRSTADGRFLREWDKAMSQRAARRAADLTLLKAPSSNIDKGLTVRAHKAVLSVRDDNTFLVTGVLENSEAREQPIYDGPAGGWGVRLRKKGAPVEIGWVLRLPAKDSLMGADAGVLELVDITDFSTIFSKGSLSKELLFEVDSFPILRTLRGEFVLNVFYTSKCDGKDVLDDKTAWTGTVISPDVVLKLGSNAEIQKSGIEK